MVSTDDVIDMLVKTIPANKQKTRHMYREALISLVRLAKCEERLEIQISLNAVNAAMSDKYKKQ